ncbi:unnamed protein product [Ectocarpus sp. 6 AP-2014]
MVIGVVPRYDPHGMGMPLMSRPGGGGGSGGGGDVPVTGRQRAATASSLEQPREESILPAAALDAGRVISRRNSSPDPTSPSPPLGSNSSGSARGDGVAAATAAEAPAAASPPVALEPPRADVRATSPVARRAAAGWPVPSGWVGGRSGGGDSRSDVLARHTRRHSVSAPLLGSFPFSFWRMLQTSTVDGQAEAGAAAAATTTGAGHSRTAAADPVQRRHGGSSTETSGDSDSAEATGSGGEDGAGIRRETDRGVEGEGQGVVPVFSPPSGSRDEEQKEKNEAGETQRAENTPVPACAGSAVPQADAPAPAAGGPDGRQAVAGPAGNALLGRGGPTETTKPLRNPIAVAGAAADVAAAPAGGQPFPPTASGCPDEAAAAAAAAAGGGGGASPSTVGPGAASTAGVRSNKTNDVTVATNGNEDGSDGHHRERDDGGEAAEGGSWTAAGGGAAAGGRAHAGAGGSGAVVSGRGMTSPAWASPGPADGAGQVFGGGGQRQQQQQQQHQQWEEERLLQGQESPRRDEDSGDVLRLGLGGTQRWPDNEPGDSGGRDSPPMASSEGR